MDAAAIATRRARPDGGALEAIDLIHYGACICGMRRGQESKRVLTLFRFYSTLPVLER